jgi:hypothetical protein
VEAQNLTQPLKISHFVFYAVKMQEKPFNPLNPNT